MFQELRTMRWGVALVLLALLFGFGLGGVFGAAEASLKEGLNRSAQAVLEPVYQGDGARLVAVVKKSWSYMKRAHMHGGGMGGAALALLLLLAATPASRRFKQVASGMLGAGCLGYPVFWLLAAQRAPGLGSTGAAKESLAWLAQPSAGLFLLGTLLVAGAFLRAAFLAPEE